MTDPTPVDDKTDDQNDKPDDQSNDDKPTIEFTDEQRRELDRRVTAARKDGERFGRTKAQKDADDKSRDDQIKRDNDEKVKRGEFDTVRQSLESERDTIKSERDSFATRIAEYEKRDQKRIDDGLGEIPDDLKAFDPGADAPLDQRLRWFETAQAESVKRTDPKTAARIPITQRPNVNEAQAAVSEQDRLRQSGKYTPF